MLCNSTTSIDSKTVEAQPGIARSVNQRIPKMIQIAAIEINISATEMISRRLAICSIKTEIAPKPWSKRSVKLMLDLPAYLFPLAV